MTRGIRGATTVSKNSQTEIILNTKELIREMTLQNHVSPEDISHMFISATADINATFPAKAAREFSGWDHVPVMCMKEIEVPGSLERCIRIMMVVNSEVPQQAIKHVFHREAKVLRPDLLP